MVAGGEPNGAGTGGQWLTPVAVPLIVGVLGVIAAIFALPPFRLVLLSVVVAAALPAAVLALPAVRGWKRWDVAIIVALALASETVGVLVILPVSGHRYLRHEPPPAGAITALMAQEAEAGVTRDISLVDRIYAGDATVTDAKCQSPGAERIWANLNQIETRYRKLPKFLLIQHVDPVIRFTPDNSRATEASATAETVAETNPRNPAHRPVFTFADERWTFERRGEGTWVITSFTFDICLAQSGA